MRKFLATTQLQKSPKKSVAIFVAFLIFVMLFSFAVSRVSISNAQTVSALQSQIDQRAKDMAKLEKEIKEYQSQLVSLSSQANSLSATIKSLNLTRKQLEAKISLTEDKISAKKYEIKKLQGQIGLKEGNISDDRRIIRQAFSSIYQSDNHTIVEEMLGSASISESLDHMASLGTLQNSLYLRIGSLTKDKEALEVNKKSVEKATAELLALNNQLADERKIILSTTAEQTELLKQTNQSETSYKKLLASKKAEEAELQQEINNLEKQLNLLVNPSSIPHTGSGVLSWPLPDVRITQYFGNTPFSTANPQIYNGKGHTGVDFAASIGTPVRASLDGIVVGVANTDLYKGCYSYGKWIMIKHPNGLSTLYAHLSLQNVAVGQNVTTGQLIGYSGNTGYSTGPHLHFGVYATEGVVIKKFDTSVKCKGATIPIADFSAYLNPMSYL